MKYRLCSFGVLLCLWQVIAVSVGKNLIVPYPLEVLSVMGNMVMSIEFYSTLLITLSHVFIMVIVSFVVSLILAYLCYQYKAIHECVVPVVSMIQAIPNVSFIILVLIWASSLQTVYIVLFLVMFPLLFQNILEGLKGIDRDICDVIAMYHPPFIMKMRSVYIPLIRHSLLAGMMNAICMGVKVSVMAEILAALPFGIGRALNLARIQFDMASIFAWTIYLMIFIYILEYSLRKVVKKKMD